MTVQILLNETKEHGGDLKGEDTTEQGTFSIPIEIDSTVPAGNYQVLAHTLRFFSGNTVYLDSWSDPSITVYTPTQVTIETTGTLYVGEPFEVIGTFSETVGDQPIVGESLRLEQDGVMLVSVTTDDRGQFNRELVFDSPGIHVLRVVYSGSEFLDPLEFKEDFPIWLKTEIQLNMPGRAIVNRQITITGALLDSQGLPMGGQTVIVLDGNTSVASGLTNSNGVFSAEVTFRTLGMRAVTARFESVNFWEGSQALAQLPVFMPTSLETNLDTVDIARVGGVVEILAALTDLSGRVPPGATLNFRDGDRIVGTVATPSQGSARFEWRPEVPGDRLFSVEFPEGGFYLASSDQVLVPVFMPTTLEFVPPPQ